LLVDKVISAEVVPSYTLLMAAPVTVSGALVMLALVVAVEFCRV